MLLLFVIGTGYLNDNIIMELIVEVDHFYVASYSREKKTRSTFYPDGRYVTVVIYRNSVEIVCNLR